MIHYHGAPCSGPADLVGRFYLRRHAMVSFAHPEQLSIIAESAQSFVLDNGAFSAWKLGDPLDFNGYLAWVSQWHRHPGFDWCLIPDVIDGSEAENNAMLDKWRDATFSEAIDSVPVWRLHESLNRLKRLSRTWRTVALGSSGQWPNPGNDPWKERMAEVMDAVCDEGVPRCKLHGLRMLNQAIFTRYPFASADSTNAPQNAGASSRFGMYPPVEAFARANVIADRIEAQNSAPVWVQAEKQLELFA